MSSSLIYKVRRKTPELIRPAKPTPKELKLLSDIDDQPVLRFQLNGIQIFRANKSMEGIDPVQVMRDAIAKALVFYYPFAGRLREGPGGKLMVDCTGEGVLFVEGDADVTSEQFGDPPMPPFPCFDELLYEVLGFENILHSPLLHFQVTRLACGGFILAFRKNHTMCDAAGICQFLSAVGEIVRGDVSPSIQPVWQRDLLTARTPPRITCTHPEYITNDATMIITSLNDLVHHNFLFGPNEIATLKKFIPSHLVQRCSTFELLTAFIWRCRTIALQMDPDEKVMVCCTVDARAKLNPPLPCGYYGNAFAFSPALTTVERLCSSPLEYAIELVTKVKSNVTDEYMRSLADLMVIKGRPRQTAPNRFLMSDLTKSAFDKIDYGWGMAAYGGPSLNSFIIAGSFYIPVRNSKSEKQILIPICLPALAMERLVNEINCMLNGNKFQQDYAKKKSPLARSAL